jgi:acetate kinase
MYYVTINAGSSSIKFSLFDANSLSQESTGSITGVGFAHGKFSVSGIQDASQDIVVSDHQAALDLLKQWLEEHVRLDRIGAIGHRIVHGGSKYSEPCVITDQVVADLHAITALDPTHLPVQINIITAMRQHFPDVTQVACFDTAFFHDLPLTGRLLPLPRKYESEGVRRYGFHGLSYSFLLQEFERVAGSDAAHGKIVLAHLGNGASLAAVKGGKPIDTTMGFTPFGGIPMSTRSGDLDPGLIGYLARKYTLSAEAFDKLVGFESGLLGVSGSSSDMKQLIDEAPNNPKAQDAIDIFCYNVKKTIGAYTAALGGLNSVIFSGGIGEVAPLIRARICEGLGDFGITLDNDRNQANAQLISADGSRVGVHVLATNEAATIAEQTAHIMKQET